MKADVIFAPKRAGIGQRTGGDQAPQIGAGFEFDRQTGQKFFRRCLLHEPNQWLKRAEVESIRRVHGESGSETEIACDGRADASHEHSAANISQKLTTSQWGIHFLFFQKLTY